MRILAQAPVKVSQWAPACVAHLNYYVPAGLFKKSHYIYRPL